MEKVVLCPHCKNELKKEGKSYTCKNNHNFDLAKAGYLNLLTNNKKYSGDDKEMLLNRRNFLRNGHYEKLAAEIVEALKKVTKESDLNKKHPSKILVDVGCGEGYYTDQLAKAFEGYKTIGIDISKEAVQLGAKAYKEIDWFVASADNLPLANSSADIVTCLFSRNAPSEYARVLKAGAILLLAIPAKNHLLELKEALYDEVKLDYYSPLEELDPYFSLKDKVEVNYFLELNNKEILALFEMTPYKWKTSIADRDKLKKLEKLKVRVSVNLYLMEKRENQ